MHLYFLNDILYGYIVCVKVNKKALKLLRINITLQRITVADGL